MAIVRNTLNPVPRTRKMSIGLISPAGWRSSGAIEVLARWPVDIGDDGSWSVDLPPQSSYVVANTWYQVVEPGASHAIVVPDTPAGPHNLYALLVDPVPADSGWSVTPRMSQLRDGTALATATNGQVPTWQASTQTWVPATPSGGGAVTSVAGRTGDVVLAEADITGLVADLAGKQSIDADLTAIAALAPADDTLMQRKAGAWTARTPGQVKTDLTLTKSDVGLGNVDNTTDAGKPISAATQTALNTKATPGDISTAVTAHEGAGNPHPTYLTQAEGDGLYAVTAHTHLYAPRIGVTGPVWVTSGSAGGDAPPNTAGSWAHHTAIGEIARTAAVGDLVTVDVTFLAQGADTTLYDVAVLVGGSLVWFASSGDVTPSIEGDPALYPQNGVFQGLVTRASLVVAPDHLDGGSVRFGLAVKSAGSGKTYYATTYPLRWTVTNHGPVAV